jgi:predicted RNA-binding Zn-ribbon protein involved in translation (DUF1610 family)
MSDIAKLPCPLCGLLLDIRESVKGKPYAVCDPCGMQLFIRKEQGIDALEKILAGDSPVVNPFANKLREKIQSLEKQLSQTERNYEVARGAHFELAQIKRQLRDKDQRSTKEQRSIRNLEKGIVELEALVHRICPECGKEFQIREDLIKTSWVNGRFQGFKCPQTGCRGIAVWKAKENQ